jgi:LysR family hydrogen peroxide-inducible transcriptional activator
MELHQLRYAVAVARTGHFNRAAEQCHVSQPSLSQQIHKLEDELGERLFERQRRGVQLTPAGERFIQRAQTVLEEVDAALREAQAGHELHRGRVTVGVLPTIAPYLLPPVISAFSRQYPGIEIVVNEDISARLLKAAADCELDIVIAARPIEDRHFEVRALCEDELLLALPTGHPLARKRAITIDDLGGERFILMREGHCLGDLVLRFCDQHDFHPCVSSLSAQIETVLSLIRTGLGISLIPRMAARDTGANGLVYRSLQQPCPTRSVVALWPRKRPPGPAAQEFLKSLEDHAARLATTRRKCSPKAHVECFESQPA